jgi:bacteriochlorophyll 4-vinyl reductase
MNDAGVGRLLVASLHQAIADLLPTRLEFYESWLNPPGLREGRIGLAPLAAVLSFLRQEGEAYRLVTERAGEYSAEWMVVELPAFERSLVQAMPDAVRLRLVARLARRMVRQTYGGSRAVIRWRKGRGSVDLRGSIFCEVRDATEQPLCEFYAAAFRRLMGLFNIQVEVGTDGCRATGAGKCLLSVQVRQNPASTSAPGASADKKAGPHESAAHHERAGHHEGQGT